ncbi:MAG: hypothetical protein RMI56_03130 [Sulfolobales archaeon]|nr:hypothetical protein [Sulfolobales archaeon]MDW8082774.1 hypothetical protein [Sulfolobales archaeon]
MRWSNVKTVMLSALLLLLVSTTSFHLRVVSPTVQDRSTQIDVEVLGSILVVDLYACLSESYMVIKAVGSPIAVLRVEPQHVYATLEGETISILTTQQPTCVLVKYVSEALYIEKALRIQYSGETSKLAVKINFSNSIPTLLSPDPDYVNVLRGGIVEFTWVNAEKVLLEYIVFFSEPTASLTTTASTTPTATSTATHIITQTVETASPLQQTTSLRDAETPHLDTTRNITVNLRYLGVAAAIASLVIVFVVVVLKSTR